MAVRYSASPSLRYSGSRISFFSHILFNRAPHAEHRGTPGLPKLWKLLIGLVALDTYTRLYIYTLSLQPQVCPSALCSRRPLRGLYTVRLSL